MRSRRLVTPIVFIILIAAIAFQAYVIQVTGSRILQQQQLLVRADAATKFCLDTLVDLVGERADGN
jgi:hypothetical protein